MFKSLKWFSTVGTYFIERGGEKVHDCDKPKYINTKGFTACIVLLTLAKNR